MESSSPPVSKAAFWAGWVLSILPCLLLLFSGVMKLVKAPEVVKGLTTQFGYPESELLILGVVEISCTIIYLIPRTAVLGAILLTGYLGGAVATGVRIEDPTFILPALLGVMIWLGLFLRDRRIRALIPLRS
jgi:hypothetical protein